MSQQTGITTAPKTAKELERAIQQYRAADLRGMELYRQWRLIREGALAQAGSDAEGDSVPGEQSY